MVRPGRCGRTRFSSGTEVQQMTASFKGWDSAAGFNGTERCQCLDSAASMFAAQ